MVFVEILIVLVLMVLNGALAMAELALVSARKVRLQGLQRDGQRGAAVALKLIDDPGSFLATVQIGITLIGILAGAFGGATLAGRLGTWLDTAVGLAPHGHTAALVLVVGGITYLSLIVGELVPKRVALRNPERVAAAVARPMVTLARVAAPAVWLLKLSTTAVLRLAGLGEAREPSITEDEVRALIADGVRAGVFVPQEREMIDGVLRLADRSVRAVMTPRNAVVWLAEGAGPDDIRAVLTRAPHTRYPVCAGAIDHVVGVAHTKDLLERVLAGSSLELGRDVVPPLSVPDRTPVLRLLDRFRNERRHLAIVVDEFGATEGLVTPTDVLEAIAGDLPEPGEIAEARLARAKDGSWLVDGLLPVDELEHRLGLRGLRGRDYDTVAGYVLDRLGHLPAVGESFETEGAEFEVVDMDGLRIDRVRVRVKVEGGADGLTRSAG